MENIEKLGNLVEEDKALELKNILDEALSGPNKLETYSAFAPFIQEMKQKYPELEMHNYRLFHILSSSTPKEGHELHGMDLPGGEIEQFIRSLAEPKAE